MPENQQKNPEVKAEIAPKTWEEANTQEYFEKPEINQKVKDFLANNQNIKELGKENTQKSLNDFLNNKENRNIKKKLERNLQKNIDNPEECNKILTEFISDNIKLTVSEKEQPILLEENNKNTIQTSEINNNLNKIDLEKTNKLFLETEEARKALIEKNPQLDVKVNKEEQDAFKNSDIGKSLVGKVSDEQINNYVLFKSTQKAIESDPSVKKEDCKGFLESFKKLENQLDIPDTKRDAFSSENIVATSKEIFDKDTGNQNLIKTVETQKEAHKGEFKELFNPKSEGKEDMSEEEKIAKLDKTYGKFLPEEQKTYKDIQEQIKKKEEISPEEKKENKEFMEKYTSHLEAKKSEFEEITSTSMEQAGILWPIMGISSYMDMDIGNKFEYNKSNDVTIKNDMLSITGHIENKPFTLISNLEKPSKLQTSDYLNKTNEKTIGLGSENTQETAYILPGKGDIRAKIKETFTTEHGDLLEKSDSLEKYQETIQKTFCEKVKDLYGYKDLVKIRMEKQMGKDVAAQETVEMFKSVLLEGKTLPKTFQQETTNPKIFQFLSNLDYSLENLSNDEINNRRGAIKEFKTVIEDIKNDQKGAKNNVKEIKNINKETLENTKTMFTKGEGKEPNLFSFFDTLTTEQGKNEHAKLYNTTEFFNMMKENRKIEPNKNRYANIEENQNKIYADNNMETSLKQIPDPKDIPITSLA